MSTAFSVHTISQVLYHHVFL